VVLQRSLICFSNYIDNSEYLLSKTNNCTSIDHKKTPFRTITVRNFTINKKKAQIIQFIGVFLVI